MKRTVAKLVAPERFELVEEPLPALKPGELLLRIQSCGLCHSEIPTYLGKRQLYGYMTGSTGRMIPSTSFAVVDDIQFPVLMGHEPVAVVEDKGTDVTGFKTGDLVGGWKRQCFADYAVLDPARLVKLPAHGADPRKLLVEPVTCAVNIARAASPAFGDTVAVVGCGFMGLLCVAALKQSGAYNLVALDLMDERLELAKRIGASHVANPKTENVPQLINDLTGGQGADIVIEISGRMAGLSLAAAIVRQRGKMLMPSLYGEPEPMDAGHMLMLKSPIIHVTHPWYSTDYDRDQLIAAEGFERGVFPMDELVTHELPLDRINEAFQQLQSPPAGYIKGIVVP